MDAVHTAFEARHSTSSWAGEGRRFGEGVAILVGDFAFVYADMLLSGVNRQATEIFNELRLEVNVGQFLDLVGTVRRNATPEMARTICQYKSGKYTIERPLHLGAALAGRLDELAAPLTAYGMPLGEAFQLKDDLLGAFGDPDAIGKPVGDDFREGKPTALYAIARGRATGSAAALLDTRFGAADLTVGEVAAIQEVFERTGARDEVEALIDQLVDDSLTAAAELPVAEKAQGELIALGHFIAGRTY
jgi:geranylgeranyl diphosphate synthase type I